MKITLTGSLGHISKPLTKELVEKGHSVTVISSSPERKSEIEALGAKAAIGTMEDADFLTETFTGADIVYLMEPADRSVDVEKLWTGIAHRYAQAIQQSGVTKVIHLSSVGAHTDEGNGLIYVHHDVENILKQLPNDVSIKFMRVGAIYYNMFAFIPTIKAQGTILQNYGGDKKEPWVSPLDIAAVIAEEMEKPFDGKEVRYIASDEVSPNEVANVLGEVIGKPDLEWKVISDERQMDIFLNAGFHQKVAKGFVEVGASRRSGKLCEDYNRHKPDLGEVKLTDFAREFAAVYHQNKDH